MLASELGVGRGNTVRYYRSAPQEAMVQIQRQRGERGISAPNLAGPFCRTAHPLEVSKQGQDKNGTGIGHRGTEARAPCALRQKSQPVTATRGQSYSKTRLHCHHSLSPPSHICPARTHRLCPFHTLLSSTLTHPTLPLLPTSTLCLSNEAF